MTGKNWWEKKKIEPESIGNIVDRWLSDSNFEKGQDFFRISSLWNEIVEPKIQEHTRLARFRKNILEVFVDSPSYLYELTNFRKQEILEAFQKKCPEFYLSDIYFKIGEIDCE